MFPVLPQVTALLLILPQTQAESKHFGSKSHSHRFINKP